jgi:serine protease Do
MFALFSNALDDLLARVKPALAVVRDGHRGAGAGIHLGEGLVLTNNHVVRRDHAQVLFGKNDIYEARTVARDPDVDLALLQIPVQNGLPAALLADKMPRPGEMVFALGHPWGERDILTVGVLSALATARNRRGEFKVLRTDARLAPGNSGGPLLNAAGEVIGLNAMIVGGDQSVAIPVNIIRTFLQKAGVELRPEAVH